MNIAIITLPWHGVVSPFTVVVDTREQVPFDFRSIPARETDGGGCVAVRTVVKGLATGDYSIEGWENRVVVERKSLTDLYGTLGRGRERFEREFDRLAEMGYPVVPMIGGAKPADNRFLNQRAENYWTLRRLLMKGVVQLPNDLKLINEMGSIKYLLSGSGRTIQVEAKQEIKKRLGHSPDYADAVVYAYADANMAWTTSILA